jgi:anti-sigma B factor antagonist
MQIAQHESNGVTVLAISGRIDATVAELFKENLLAAIGDRPVRLLLDFGQVDFISSIGLRVLVVAAKRLAAVRGKLLFCCVEGPVREVFELAGFTSVAALFPSREAALASTA